MRHCSNSCEPPVVDGNLLERGALRRIGITSEGDGKAFTSKDGFVETDTRCWFSLGRW